MPARRRASSPRPWRCVDGMVVVDGDEHMRKRPIGPLVTALHSLGIAASAPTGCPPVMIEGRGHFGSGRVEIDGGLVQQYVSALLMAAPFGDGAHRRRARPAKISMRAAMSTSRSRPCARFGAEVQPARRDELARRSRPAITRDGFRHRARRVGRYVPLGRECTDRRQASTWAYRWTPSPSPTPRRPRSSVLPAYAGRDRWLADAGRRSNAGACSRRSTPRRCALPASPICA